MKILMILLALSALILPAQAQESDTLNKAAHISALVHCEREPRAKKFLYLVPGKIKHYHYEVVMPDGSTVVKVQDYKMPGVYDRRELKESHPNIAIALPALQQFLLAGINAGTFILR